MRIELPFVSFSISEQRKILGMLPQAHTCENILELPNYWEALLEVQNLEQNLEQKLEQNLEQNLDIVGTWIRRRD